MGHLTGRIEGSFMWSRCAVALIVFLVSPGKNEKVRAWSRSRSKAPPSVTQDVVTASPVTYLN